MTEKNLDIANHTSPKIVLSNFGQNPDISNCMINPKFSLTNFGQGKIMVTEFQMKVYSAVSKIPKGEVRSYKWVAKQIGNPKACRAVGNALNKNPYAPLVPCHRIIKSDGSIGGFAKGITLKKRLLKKEGVDCSRKHCYNLTRG